MKKDTGKKNFLFANSFLQSQLFLRKNDKTKEVQPKTYEPTSFFRNIDIYINVKSLRQGQPEVSAKIIHFFQYLNKH